MPKMKTHRGAAKRFKVTARGKLMRRQSMRNHLREKKSATRLRRLGDEVPLTGARAKKIRTLLGR